MNKLISLALLFLSFLQGRSQGVPSDSIHYLLAGNLDSYSAWSFSKQSGTTGTISNYNGLNGNGLKVNYTFPSSGGWVNLEIPASANFTKSNPLVLYIYTTNGVDNLEIKFIDNDGSVFDVRPSLSKFTGGWHPIIAYLDNTSYAWGGNSTFDNPAKFSLAISGSVASSGTVYFDEIGIGKAGLPSSFQPTIDPNSQLTGIGFLQRRDVSVSPEDPLVLKYLQAMQDQGSQEKNLLPTYYGGLQAQTFNNCLVAMAYLAKDEKQRAERILDFYLNATDSNNMQLLKQNFFYNRQARGFFQECDIHTFQATGAKNRWIGDMAWLLISCKNYQKKYNSTRYDFLIGLIKNLFLSFYKEASIGGYIQHGWENGDANLHESFGHHEGNIDCYVALKLCAEDFLAHKIKLWLDDQLNGRAALPLDLYTWRTLAFGALGEPYSSLLNIPEYDFRYRKIINVKGKETMGMFSNPDITIQNFWNDGTGHLACAFQNFGDRQRGYFYANQLDALIVSQVIENETTHGIPYTLNTQGYPGVNPAVPVISSSAWYILAKNGINPFLSENFRDEPTGSAINVKNNSRELSAYPNPFTKVLTINYPNMDNSIVSVHIYNSMGQIIKTLVSKNPVSGNHRFMWDGTDSSGKKVNNGVYLLQLISGQQVERTKLFFFGN